MTLSLDNVLEEIDLAMREVLRNEIKNIYGAIEPQSARKGQLNTGFQRIIDFEVDAIDMAKRKFTNGQNNS